jgi:hypothetical protein
LKDTIIAMTHYTGYFGTLLVLWITMMVSVLDVKGLFRELLLLLLVVLSLLFGVIGLVYIIGGVGFARRG